MGGVVMPRTAGIVRNYINGKWVPVRNRAFLEVRNPANDKVLAQVPVSGHQEVQKAVEAARRAFPTWRATPLSHRIEQLSRLRDLIARYRDELALSITTEHGKLLRESQGELTRALENMTYALNSDLMSGRYLAHIASGGISIYSRRVPLGVFCGITPFNFPAMIPFWFLPYALLAGNTYVLKPSERTPLTMTRICELVQEAGFPPGVVNLVHGDRSTALRLVGHPDIVGVSSVSSTPAMMAIQDAAARLGKRFQCQGGAKNFVVVTSDVQRAKVVPHIIESVFGNTGQRCLAGSNVVLVGPERFYRSMVEDLYAVASQMKVGEGTRPDVDMGPVISRVAKERIISYIEKGIAEGANLLLDGRKIDPLGDPAGYWLGPSIFTQVNPDMVIACDEIFGPVMTILRAKSIEQVISWINNSAYGNAAMVFTESGKVVQRFREDDVQVGNLGLAIGLPAPIPPFPFGGMKDSFRGDLHGQGTDPIRFFTQEKIIIERWL